LADLVCDPALLRGADAIGQNVAHPQEVAVGGVAGLASAQKQVLTIRCN
jgi:hypothetical protein